MYKIDLKLIRDLKRSQHVIGWTWKHEDFDRLCPKILPGHCLKVVTLLVHILVFRDWVPDK